MSGWAWPLAAAVLLAPWPGVPEMAALRARLPRRGTRGRDSGAQEAVWAAALVGELRAGADTTAALLVCARQYGVGGRAARAARLGSDVADALRQEADSDRSLLAVIAAVWDVQLHSGAGLADVLEQLADSHRRATDVRRTLAVELAGPRATARTMSLLPVVGVGLGMLLGADPISWLTTTIPGVAVLLAGVGCNIAGIAWIRSIVAAVERSL